MIVNILIKFFNFIRILLDKLPPAMNGKLTKIFKDLHYGAYEDQGEGKVDAPSRNLEEGREEFRIWWNDDLCLPSVIRS